MADAEQVDLRAAAMMVAVSRVADATTLGASTPRQPAAASDVARFVRG